MKKADIQQSVSSTLGGLKDFQRATVDVVHHRLFSEGQKSMLIADEVGLGKTIIAKGIIAREIQERIEAGRRGPLRVTYICSNQVIAAENVKKLNVFSDRGVIDQVARRIAYLAYEPDEGQAGLEQVLRLNSLTPATSFSMASRSGTKAERAIIYSLLCEDEEFHKLRKGLSCLLRGPVRSSMESWRAWLEKQRKWNLRADLAEKFLKAIDKKTLQHTCRGVLDDLDIKASASLSEAVWHMASVLRSNNMGSYHESTYQLLHELRRALNKACLDYIDADLYILDEFQRFSGLIDTKTENEEAVTARHIFKKKKAKILLLSATPFKAFTGDLDEAQGEDHYEDFRKVLTFLANDQPGQLDAYDEHRQALYNQLLGLTTELLDLDPEHRVQIERVLRQFVCRTERHSVATDPSEMIADTWRDRSIPFGSSDINNFVATDQVVHALAKALKESGRSVGSPMEYCKSAPVPLSFLDGYVLKQLLAESKRDPAVRKALQGHQQAWLDVDAVDNYQLRVGMVKEDSTQPVLSHARLTQVVDQAVGEYGANHLWIPPSLPYYPLAGVYEHSHGFSKTLIFSAWVMVPRAIASLISYEVERRTIGDERTKDPEREPKPRTYFGARDDANYKRHPAPLLTFSRGREDGRRVMQSMSNFCLLYPSPSLAAVTDGAELLRSGQTLSELRLRFTQEMERMIAGADLVQYEVSAGTSEKWYWAAPLLIDRADKTTRQLIQAWFEDDTYDGNSAYFSAGGKEGGAKAQHFARLIDALEDPTILELGPLPKDLAEVLADMVLGSPAVTALRSLSAGYGIAANELQVEDLANSFDIANEFLNLFNKPESITAIRLNGTEGFYWRQALRYSADGCIQAVLDEYLHLLKGQIGNRKDAVKGLVDTVNLNTASINVDGMNSFLKGKPQKMRCHYAVEFGNQKIETDEGQKRATSTRANFNSPFRPFVLATTSIGQEGLDFHQYCRRIVHWNLPSNPIDLEQREGRINRYKGLVVRQQLAHRYAVELASGGSVGDLWDALFALADQRERVAPGKCELIPYWHTDTNEFMIERVIPMYPFSRDQAKLDHILKTLAIYRLAFGQPRQVELVEQLLSKDFSREEIADICGSLMINLSPIAYRDG